MNRIWIEGKSTAIFHYLIERIQSVSASLKRLANYSALINHARLIYSFLTSVLQAAKSVG